MNRLAPAVTAAALSLSVLTAGTALTSPAAARTTGDYALSHLRFESGSLWNKPSCKRGVPELSLAVGFSLPTGSATPRHWKFRVAVHRAGTRLAKVRATGETYGQKASVSINCSATAKLMKHGFGANKAARYVYRITSASAKVGSGRHAFVAGVRARSTVPHLVKVGSIKARALGSNKYRITGSFVEWDKSKRGYGWRPASKRVRYWSWKDACSSTARRSRGNGRFAFVQEFHGSQRSVRLDTKTSYDDWSLSKRGKLTPMLRYGGC